MANTYLTRTTGTSTLNTKCTFSGWYKRSILGTYQHIFSVGDTSGAQLRGRFRDTDTFQLYANITGQGEIQYITNRKFRDTSAWYHILISIDCTQSASNRVKLYFNGIEETSFDGTTQAEITSITLLNSQPFQIGRRAQTADTYFDGSISHFHFIDGTAYDASYFGSTDATTGEWKINTSPSVTYGNNGFFILKDGNSVTDQSPNSNNFTVGGGTLTKTEDCPSNVFCTMNPLDNYWQGSTFANGNNTITTSASKENYNTSTLAMPSNDAGKYYCEVKMVSASAYTVLGLADKLTTSATSNFKNHTYGYALTSDSGNIINNNNSSSYGVSFTTNDIIGIAVDTDNNKLYFSKNGTWMNSGVPTSGSTGTGAISISATTTNGYYMFASGTRHNDSLQASWNFGNGYFGTTAVSSAGTNASGNGIFEYDCPAGFTALSTKGLNL